MALGFGYNLGLIRSAPSAPAPHIQRAVTADGSNDYLTRSSALSAVNSKQGSIAMLIRPTVLTSMNLFWSGFLPGGPTIYRSRVSISLAAAGGEQFKVSVTLQNSSNTNILVGTSDAGITGTVWNFIAFSWDLENDDFSSAVYNQFASNYRNYTSADANITTYSNDTPDYTSCTLSQFGRGNPSILPNPLLNASVCNVSLSQNYIDWTVSDTRDEYFTVGVGSVPTPSDPTLYSDDKIVLLTSDAANYGVNDAGANFTIVGAFADTTVPGV